MKFLRRHRSASSPAAAAVHGQGRWQILRFSIPITLLLAPAALTWLKVPAYAGMTGAMLFAGSAASIALVLLLVRNIHLGLLLLSPFALPAALAAVYVHAFSFTPGAGLWLSLLNANAAEIDSVLRMFAGPIGASLAAGLLYLACLVGPPLHIPSRNAAYCIIAAVVATVPIAIASPIESAQLSQPGRALWWRTFPFGMTSELALTVTEELSSPPQDIKLPVASRTPVAGKEIYVLVIGEATRRDTWEQLRAEFPVLYGNQHQYFSDAISQAVYTKFSVPMLLTGVTGPGYRGKPQWLHFAKATGCNPVWLTMNDIGTPYQGLAEYFDNWRVPRAERLHDDMGLLPMLGAALRQHEKVCVLMHLEGAHDRYAERYPGTFRPHPVERSEPVNGNSPTMRARQKQAYVHAVAYSKEVLSRVIAEVDQHGAHSLVLFTPDHGENLWDDERQLVLHGFGTRLEFDIPLHVWASEQFIASRPDAWRMLKANATNPISNASVLPTLLDAMGIAGKHPGSLFGPLAREDRLVSLESVVMPYRLIR